MGRRGSSSIQRTQPKPNVEEPPASNGTVIFHGTNPELRLPMDSGLQKKSTNKKKSKSSGTYVRRSQRLKKAIVCAPNTNFDFGEIQTISDDEIDSDFEQLLRGPELVLEPPLDHESQSEPEQEESFGEKNLDEKVESALHRLDSLDEIVALLKTRVEETAAFCEAPSGAPGYKSMYFDSQKKIEALTEENLRLNGKLENALGKLDVYEKEIRSLIDGLNKTKDSDKDGLILNLAKSVEAAVNVLTQNNASGSSSIMMKRKRNEG